MADLSSRLPINVVLILKNQQLRIKSKYVEVEKNDVSTTSTTKRKGGGFSRHYLQHLLIPEKNYELQQNEEPEKKEEEDIQAVAILVTFLDGVKLKKTDLKDAIKYSTISRYGKNTSNKKLQTPMDFLDIILVLNEDVTPPAVSALNEFVKQSSNTLNIQVFKRKDLAWDKSTNHYVQTYEVKDAKDVPLFLKENKIPDSSKLPKIFTTDPMSKLYGFKLGQLVRAIDSMYWRIVVTENHITQDDEDITEGKKSNGAKNKLDDDDDEINVPQQEEGEGEILQDDDCDTELGCKKRKSKTKEDEDDDDDENDDAKKTKNKLKQQKKKTPKEKKPKNKKGFKKTET